MLRLDKKFILCVCFFAANLSVSSQNLRIIVKEESNNIAVVGAMVELWSDSVRHFYGFTDNTGLVIINSKDSGKHRLTVRALGFEYQEDTIIIEKKDITKTLLLQRLPIELDEVVVKAFRHGVSYKTDTIKYNPQVFSDGTESTLGDILRKLPGIQVDQGGNVRAQGKEVSKIMLNGQDFFEGNTQMATKNLSADVAKSVEVLHNYSEYSLLKGFQTRERTVINIGVDSKRLDKLSGQLNVGGGVRDKWSARGDLMRIGTKSMANLIVTGNNTGDALFSMEDFFRNRGGIGELLSDGGRFQISSTESELLKPQNNVFRRDNTLYAANFTSQSLGKYKLNVDLLYNNSDAHIMDEYQYSFGAFEKRNQSENRGFLQGSVRLSYTPDSTTVLSYRNEMSNFNLITNSSIQNEIGGETKFINELRKRSGFKSDNNLTLLKSFGANLWVTALKYKYSLLPDLYQASGIIKTPMSELSHNVEFSSSWLNPILNKEGYYLRFNVGVVHSTDKFNYDQSNIDRYTSDIFGGIDFVKNLGIIRFKLGGKIHRYNFNNSKPLTALTPIADLALNFSNTHRMSFNWNDDFIPRSSKLFYQDTIIYSYNYFTTKSNLLKQFDRESSIGFNYMFTDMFYRLTLIVTSQYRFKAKGATYDYLQKSDTTYATPIESLRSYQRGDVDLSFTKGIGMIPIEAKFTGTYRFDKNSNYILDILNKIDFVEYATGLSIESNFKKIINGEVGIKIVKSTYTQSLSNEVSQNLFEFNSKVKFSFTPNLYFEIQYQFKDNSIEDFRMHNSYINSLLRYRFKNQKNELSLIGRNLLHMNQQRWASISYRNGYFIERYYNQIPGYLLISYCHKF